MIQPSRAEIIVNRLAGKSAHIEPHAIQLNLRFRTNRTDKRFSGHQIVKGDRSRIGPQSNNPTDKPIAEFDLSSVRAGRDMSDERLRTHQPIAGGLQPNRREESRQ